MLDVSEGKLSAAEAISTLQEICQGVAGVKSSSRLNRTEVYDRRKQNDISRMNLSQNYTQEINQMSESAFFAEFPEVLEEIFFSKQLTDQTTRVGVLDSLDAAFYDYNVEALNRQQKKKTASGMDAARGFFESFKGH